MDFKDSSFASLMPVIIGLFVVGFAILVLIIIALWKVFEKAGEEGWKCIIPFYNGIVLLKIVGKPWWWIFLLVIPYVSIIFHVWVLNLLSKSFGKDEGFTVGLVFLGFIFLPILGFGSAVYQGPYGNKELYEAYRQRTFGTFDFEKHL